MWRRNTPPQRLEKIPPGSELLSETEIIFLLETKGQQPASGFRAACGQGGRAARGARAAGSKRRGAAGSATCSRWRTSGARSSSSGSLTGRCTWHSASSRTSAKIRQRRQHKGQAHQAPGQRARGRHQEVPAARPRHPVLTGALHCCSRASPSTSSPTFNCPLPRLRRPPADLNAAITDKDCDTSGAPLVSQRTMGPGPGLVARVLW